MDKLFIEKRRKIVNKDSIIKFVKLKKDILTRNLSQIQKMFDNCRNDLRREAELKNFSKEQIKAKIKDIEERKFDGLSILDEQKILNDVFNPSKIM